MNVNHLLGFFLKNNSVKEFINNINNTNRGLKIINNKIRPLACLISFNFIKNKITNFKIYCEIFKNFKDDDILKFLPNAEDFKKYIKFWGKTIESSLCFGIKIDRHQVPTQYFHIKFSENTFLEEFNNLEISKIFNITNKRKGLSIEYTKQNKIIKTRERRQESRQDKIRGEGGREAKR
jgi:hypothetical protein